MRPRSLFQELHKIATFFRPSPYWLGVFMLTMALVTPSGSMAQPMAGNQCSLEGIGAATWFLASLPSVNPCDLLHMAIRPSLEPTPLGMHRVAEGETLSEIAALYGVTTATLQALNDLEDTDLLRTGMLLRLPKSITSPQISATPLMACYPQTTEIPLDLPWEPIRLVAWQGILYMLAGGQLYALPESMAQPPATPLRIAPAAGKVDGVPVQELVDLVVDDASGELVLLDKSGDLYGYHPLTGRWRLRMRAQPLPGFWLDPQYITIAAHQGAIYGLDVDGARLWRMANGQGTPLLENEAEHLAYAVDLASMGGTLYLLNANGTLTDAQGHPYAAQIPRLAWPVDLNAVESGLLAVDGQARRILLIEEGRVRDVTLAIPGMRWLRSATVSGHLLYAIAGPNLYRYDLESPPQACRATVYDDRLLFYGIDLAKELPPLQLPFAGGQLPNRPRSYPGARRLYRYGIHQGVDFYAWDAPNLTYGSPVKAIAAGRVIRIDHDFVEIPPAEYEVIMAEIEALHSTPPHWLDKLRGQQVWIEHAPGIVSRYAHLSSVAPNLQVGDPIQAGQIVGTVGVSGTSSGVYGSNEGFHLHWEIWVHGQYLGFGLTLQETMRLWQALF